MTLHLLKWWTRIVVTNSPWTVLRCVHEADTNHIRLVTTHTTAVVTLFIFVNSQGVVGVASPQQLSQHIDETIKRFLHWLQLGVNKHHIN